MNEKALVNLNNAVTDAAQFFASANESLRDGEQTVREVASHIVFWHREYVAIAHALATGRPPILHTETFNMLHETAAREFANKSLRQLGINLIALQQSFALTLRGIPDWQVNFPVKEGLIYTTIEDRVPQIDAHIRNHIIRLRRISRKQGGAR